MMAFTIEFDDNRLNEEISDAYRRIHETQPMGQSFMDFISLGEGLQQSGHIYLRLADSDERIDHTSYTYVRMMEFVDLCIKDPSLYTMENFMFFLHLMGLSVPEHHLQYRFDPEKPVEDLLNPHLRISSFEAAIRGFAKSDKSKHAVTSVYTCDGIADICMASLYHLLTLGHVIKVCGNCGKYFVPLRRSDALYCDRVSPFNASRTCKEDGSQRAFEEKLKTDEAEKLRRQIYQAKQMRVRRNPNIQSYKESFERWKKDVNQWKKDIKKGRKTSEEFILWLEDSRKL